MPYLYTHKNVLNSVNNTRLNSTITVGDDILYTTRMYGHLRKGKVTKITQTVKGYEYRVWNDATNKYDGPVEIRDTVEYAISIQTDNYKTTIFSEENCFSLTEHDTKMLRAPKTGETNEGDQLL